MIRRLWPGLLLIGMLTGCPDGTPTPDQPTPEPLTEPGVTFPVSGTLQGPQALLSTTQVTSQLQVFSETALPGIKVYLADAKLQPLPDGPTITTAADGTFSLDSPQRAGFVMAKTASASVALSGFYRSGHPVTLSVASTMVAWKLSADMASHSVAITSIDPAKVDTATTLVNQELVKKHMSPDFSLPSWPDALDYYTYKQQGDLAKAFNAIIPGSVAPKMSR